MILRTLGLIVTLAVGVLTALPAAEGQSAKKVSRIGFLSGGDPSSPYVSAFRKGLRVLGYVEGHSIAIEYRYAEGKLDRLPALADELVHLKVDAIVAGGTPPILAAKPATTTIPIIMVTSQDPVSIGLVTSLARPGGNITGLTCFAPELSGKRLELLKETIPGATKVAVLANPAESTTPYDLTPTEAAAQSLGMRLQIVHARGPDQLEGAFSTMTREPARAFITLPSVMLFGQRRQVAELAARSRMPGMFDFREFVDAGGLISYGPSLSDLFRRAAGFVDKIVKGARPDELPVERPTRFELVINLKTAKALGLTIPRSILLRADDVIE